MNDSQVLAAKPLRSPTSTSLGSRNALNSSYANSKASPVLRPKVATTTISVSDASAGARLAALAAGTQSQRLNPSHSPERRNARNGVSPPRGRQLQPKSSVVPRATKAPTYSSTTKTVPEPTLQERSPSTLAARRATVRSSPTRSSPAHSPQRQRNAILPVKDEESIQRDTFSGAVGPITTSPPPLTPEVPQSVKTRMLNFEEIPSLPASEAIHHSEAGSQYRASSATPTKSLKQAFAPEPALRASLTGDKPRIDSVSRSNTAPINIVRHIPDRSSSTIAGQSRPSSQRPPVPSKRSGSRKAMHSNPQHIGTKHQDDYRNAMTVNSLADAMVASSLASSRAVSPANKKNPPIPPPRRSRSFTELYDMKSALEKPNPSKPSKNPPKPMKRTLRKQALSDDDEVEVIKRGRRHWMRKHPNMHSEGDRERWRDKVTERERKRYEGVFAANRGLLIGPGYFVPSASALSDASAEGNRVVNVIVRDIWERSRLPREVLREIYELVCPEESGALSREQFVVGLWLIDQRLKGRKLPVKVSTSVWASVRHTQGIKIKRVTS